MERFFNTAGPNRAEYEYTLDPLSRIDLDDVLSYIAQGKYFVLHAPRQTGKTSCMLALRDYLNASGDYVGGLIGKNDCYGNLFNMITVNDCIILIVT